MTVIKCKFYLCPLIVAIIGVQLMNVYAKDKVYPGPDGKLGIMINKPGGGFQMLIMKNTNTIYQLKQKIVEFIKPEIPIRYQTLIFEEKLLANDKKISFYKIHKGADVMLKDGRLKLTIKMADKSFVVMIDKNAKTIELKKKINKEQGIPVNKQRLNFQGSHMLDANTLEHHGVRKAETINLKKRADNNDHSPIDITVNDRYNTFKLKIKKSATIKDVRDEMDVKHKLKPGVVELAYNDKTIYDDDTLIDLGVRDKSEIIWNRFNSNDVGFG